MCQIYYVVEKDELKYIKMHKALVFLHYCLERYDCFSIYKIESGQFKFFKILHANTAIAYVGGHSHQLLLYIRKYAILHGRKQLIWSFRDKNQIGTHRFETHYLSERNQSMKGLLAIAIPFYCWKREHVVFHVQCTTV